MALESGEVLVFLGLLLVIAAAVMLWLSRHSPTKALDEVRDEARRGADQSNRQLEQLEADRAALSRIREDVERRRDLASTDRFDGIGDRGDEASRSRFLGF